MAEQIHLDSGTAKCLGCDWIFSFRGALEAEGTYRQPFVSASPVLPRPVRFKVSEWGDRWQVTWRWFTPSVLAMAVFCVAWDSFLYVWYSHALTRGRSEWFTIVFPIGHVCVGFYLTYSVLTGFLNRTTVEVRRGRLSIRHGPLPWPGNHDRSADELEQLYCEVGQTRGGRNSEPTTVYHLSATLKGGGKVRLLRGFDEADGPRYLEREIEERLRINPRVVIGEYGR